MRALVINCSSTPTHHCYNLGARKLADWLKMQGYQVASYESDPGMWELEADLVCLSVIFSWHAPVAREIALRMKSRAEVWAGGPGLFALATWWQRETGLEIVRGLDQRFDKQRGQYEMTFASRGCPVNCSFCLTPETLIQTADGLRPIAKVGVGDLVLTHLGRYRRVTEVLTREYNGIVHELRNGAVSELFPAVVTPEHPVWVRHVSYPTGGPHLTDFKWVDAGNLLPEYSRYSRDFTAFPRTSDEDMPNGNTLPGADWLPCNKDMLALIGWYLAEGYVTQAPGRGYYRVTFCLGHTDSEMEYAREIQALSSAVGLKADVWHVKIGIRVSIYNVKFARWLVATFGTGASTKHLPLWLRRLPSEMLAPLIDAWAKGDGWYQNKRGTDTWKINTSSPDLAVGLREMVLKMGYLATINRHHQNGVIQGRTVNIHPSFTVIYHAPREKGRTLLSDEKYVYSRIDASIQRPYAGTVYNLEVEEDRSYCTPAFAVHNCIVPRLEGVTFSFDPDFIPAPMLCDNNLSALPVSYQEHIISRYRSFKQPLVDANSGFEPHYFDEGTYQRWKPLLDETRAPWRFALDEMRELADVERMMTILKAESPKRKRVYCLVGNEPIAACYERAIRIIQWGGEPHCQFVLPLNWLGDPGKVKLRFDWTSYKQGQDFCRYFNTWGWRSYPIWDYKPRVNEPRPFASLALQTIVEVAS